MTRARNVAGATTTIERAPDISFDGQLRRARRRRTLQSVLGFCAPMLFLAMWQIASTSDLIDRRIYPSFSDVVASARSMWERTILQDAILATVRITLLGFALGAASGFLIGLACGLSRWVRASIEGLLSALYVVPKIAILPVFLTVFGYGHAPKIALVTVTVFFFVWIAVMEASANVPVGYTEAAIVFGANRRQRFAHVVLPAILPDTFVALRVAIGVALLVSVAADFVVGTEGLGYLIYNSTQLFILTQAYAGIVVVALLGVGLSWAVVVVGRRLTPWTRR